MSEKDRIMVYYSMFKLWVLKNSYGKGKQAEIMLFMGKNICVSK